MAKTDSSVQRIGAIVPASSVAVPVLRAEDCVNKEYYLMSYEFKVAEKGGDYVVMACKDVVSRKDVEISTFDKAIVAQLAAIPEGTPLPLLIKVVKFGRYFALD